MLLNLALLARPGALPDALNRQQPGRKLLYFTLGSTGLPATIQAVIAALRDCPYYVW